MAAFDERVTKTRLTLRAGQRGTKQLMAQYGERLVCVRYRYDCIRKKRIKTVEIVVEERDWMPDPNKRAWNVIEAVRVELAERQLQRSIKAVGGKWNAEKMVWELQHRYVVKLGLEDRVCSVL